MKFKKLLSLALAVVMVCAVSTTAWANSGPSPYTIFGEDERNPVSDPKSGLYASVAKLAITFSDGSIAYGTGFLIAPNKVATAAHCLSWTKENGRVKTATKVNMYFGATSTSNYAYYRTASSSNCTVPSGWEGNYVASDYGLITLNSPINGAEYFTLSDRSQENDSISVVGYEHCSYDTGFTNWNMLESFGTVDEVTSYRLKTKIDAISGQSGAPTTNSSGDVIGIYTYGSDNGDGVIDKDDDFASDDSPLYNYCTRITSDVIDFYGV